MSGAASPQDNGSEGWDRVVLDGFGAIGAFGTFGVVEALLRGSPSEFGTSFITFNEGAGSLSPGAAHGGLVSFDLVHAQEDVAWCRFRRRSS